MSIPGQSNDINNKNPLKLKLKFNNNNTSSIGGSSSTSPRNAQAGGLNHVDQYGYGNGNGNGTGSTRTNGNGSGVKLKLSLGKPSAVNNNQAHVPIITTPSIKLNLGSIPVNKHGLTTNNNNQPDSTSEIEPETEDENSTRSRHGSRIPSSSSSTLGIPKVTLKLGKRKLDGMIGGGGKGMDSGTEGSENESINGQQNTNGEMTKRLKLSIKRPAYDQRQTSVDEESDSTVRNQVKEEQEFDNGIDTGIETKPVLPDLSIPSSPSAIALAPSAPPIKHRNPSPALPLPQVPPSTVMTSHPNLPDRTKRLPTSNDNAPIHTTTQHEPLEDIKPTIYAIHTQSQNQGDDTSITAPSTPAPQPQPPLLGLDPNVKGKGRPYLRTRKPLKDVLKRIVMDMKRKDQYGLFLDPVDIDEFPHYHTVIGGEDYAMDLATMEGKIHEKRYKNVEEFESDVEKMIKAAELFNPEDSLVVKEANKMRALAEKHVFKSRHTIRSPSPEPQSRVSSRGGYNNASGNTGRYDSTAAGTPDLERGVSASVPPGGKGGRQVVVKDVPLAQIIPEQMMDYPSSSSIARAVGFYSTTGKRQRTQKEKRQKERWDGVWREWYTEGDRNLAEAEDITELLKDGFENRVFGLPKMIDWKDECMRAKTTWQPSLTLTGVPVDEVAPTLPMRGILPTDYGRYQNLSRDYGFKESSWHDEEALRRKFQHQVVATEQEYAFTRGPELIQSMRHLKDMTTGEGLLGEAYLRSIETFVIGAERCSKGRNWEDDSRKRKREKRQVMRRRMKKVKMESSASSEDGDHATAPADDDEMVADEEEVGEIKPDIGFDLGLALKREEDAMNMEIDFSPGEASGEEERHVSLLDHVRTEWREGWLDQGMRGSVRRAMETYDDLQSVGTIPSRAGSSTTISAESIEALISSPIEPVDKLQEIVKATISRMPALLDLQTYSARLDGVDFPYLLVDNTDFDAGVGGPPGNALGRMEWFTKTMKMTGKQILEASERREKGVLADAVVAIMEPAKMKKLRLDLLALAKNVMVHELKALTKDDLKKLPERVKHLVRVVDS